MRIHVSRRGKKLGVPPGTLVHIGRESTENVVITRCCYDENSYQEESNISLDRLLTSETCLKVEWINFDGIHDIKMVERIGANYGIDTLVLEDIVNTGQRAKVEDYGEYIYLVLKLLTCNSQCDEIENEQVSIVFSTKRIFTFQEKQGDDFEPLRDRIRKKGRIRRMGTDYLAYSILDYVADSYFIVLEKTGDRIERIEEEVLTSPDEGTLRKIHELKRDILMIKKAVWPLRDVLALMIRPENDLIQESMAFYLRDAYDHIIEIMDTVEAYREFMAGLLDIYLSGLGKRTNEIMKVLALISTVFLPLTFIAGFYGMNFRYMPGLENKAGFILIIGLMTVIVIFMFYIFKKRRWF